MEVGITFVMVVNLSRLMRGNEKCELMLIVISGIMPHLSKPKRLAIGT